MRSILCKILVVMGMISCNNRSYDDWTVYGGSAEAIKYSSLVQIDSTNVTDLKIAWEYHTGDADTAKFSQIQCNPIIVHGTLYATTPKLQLIALDAKTGKLKWSFNPDSANRNKEFYHFILNNNRGVTYSDIVYRRFFFICCTCTNREAD
jgi:quinoprotein glucose dehydrogenase